MIYNKHSELYGKHAILSPSYYHWINYDDQKLEARYYTFMSAKRGTDLHALAHQAITLGIPLHESNEALAMYVNDAIELGMQSEQPLYYSDNCFGTADTISFHDELLRVHDLKNGIIPAKPQQLKVYAGLFCLEYGFSPYDITMEFRIYQRSEVTIYEGNQDEVAAIMDKIVESDKYVQALKEADRW